MEMDKNQAWNSNFHGPTEAIFKDVSEGGFCTIDIGTHPIGCHLLIVNTSEKNLIFLRQLQKAVDRAIKYELDKLSTTPNLDKLHKALCQNEEEVDL